MVRASEVLQSLAFYVDLVVLPTSILSFLHYLTKEINVIFHIFYILFFVNNQIFEAYRVIGDRAFTAYSLA